MQELTVHDLRPLLSRLLWLGVVGTVLVLLLLTPLLEHGGRLVAAAPCDPTAIEHRIIVDTVGHYRPGSDVGWREDLGETLQREAEAAGVDPLLVAAMVARESSFRARAVSRAGAVGLMQVRPWVGQDLAVRRVDAGVDWRGLETLHDAGSNVRLGVLYYRELVDRFDGDHVSALEAYNRGPERVRSELDRGELRGTRYSSRVLDLYERLDAARASAALRASG